MRCRLLAVLLLFAAIASAIDPKQFQPQGYVSDFAGTLDASSEADLERYCTQVGKSTGVQIALVTIKTLEGSPIEDFAADLFRQWGIGKKSNDEGLLLLLVVQDKLSRLEVGRGLEPTIVDGTAGELLDAMRPALRANDYGAALTTAARSLGQQIARSKGVTIDETSLPRRRVREQPQELPFGAIVVIVFILFALTMGRGRRGGRGGGGGFLPGLILGNVLGRSSYGGYGGGGFGGYDSGGGGFGGFGGGSSGGGGASSDW